MEATYIYYYTMRLYAMLYNNACVYYMMHTTRQQAIEVGSACVLAAYVVCVFDYMITCEYSVHTYDRRCMTRYATQRAAS